MSSQEHPVAVGDFTSEKEEDDIVIGDDEVCTLTSAGGLLSETLRI